MCWPYRLTPAGGHSMSDPNSQDLLSDPPFSATLRAPFLFRDSRTVVGLGQVALLVVQLAQSASRPALPLPPLCVEEDEEEVEPRWAGPKCDGRLIQCSMADMSSPGPASPSEPDDESEHRGDRPTKTSGPIPQCVPALPSSSTGYTELPGPADKHLDGRSRRKREEEEEEGAAGMNG
ncbi:hypothetical protein F7725_029021 [Dissostichus mawsoni]|uniref:Uncharacterized protein n=1 Tax=Dissostichus mawsoni TaxID=36200 RepID=A0A7J5XI03_DISMA|nr:hypothetical protein F7725_029021 [Dissostichus mawsoni]